MLPAILYPTVSLKSFICDLKSHQQNLTSLAQVMYTNAAAVAFRSV